MPVTTIAIACLVLAAGWRAMLTLSDHRRVRRMAATYRPGLGWAGAREQDSRRRWAWAGPGAALGLVPVMLVPGDPVTGIAAMLSCGTIIAWILRDRRLHRARYTSVCIGTLAAALLVRQGSELASPRHADLLMGVFASFFAAQLYLVAGIRKLRSAQFMSGRVIIDNLAYGTYQAAAGNREFFRLTGPARLADLLTSGAFLAAGRLAAILTAVVELALGCGALGLLPVTITFALAIPSHLAFTLLSPYRIVPFAVAALGLLALAGAHPLAAAG